MIVKLLVEAGDMKPNPGIAQKLGPLGINIGKVIQEVNKATENFHGLKVPVELDINTKTKNFSISVNSPPVSELIKKELGIEKATGETKKLKSGNLAIEQIIKTAKIKMANMLSKDFKSAVKSVAGSCASLGVLIENKEAKKITEEIAQGKYDKEISEEKTEASQEKLSQLRQFFNELRGKQEEIIKKEEEAKLEEEKKKAEQPAAAQPPTEAKKEKAEEVKKKPEK